MTSIGGEGIFAIKVYGVNQVMPLSPFRVHELMYSYSSPNCNKSHMYCNSTRSSATQRKARQLCIHCKFV